MGYRLGVDVWGTFTDLLPFDDESGRFWRHKTPSTPHDSSEGILEGVRAITEAAGIAPGEIGYFLHGITVATNAMLAGKGARVGLVTTEGFRDIMQIARSYVPGGLAVWIVWPKPQPLARLEDTVEVPGRIDADGKEVRPLDEEAVRAALRKLKANGIEALTVSLINAYVNGAHERRIAEIAAEELPDIPVSLSHQMLPEMQEYERTLSTVVNAAVRPVVGRYIANLRKRLQNQGCGARVSLLRSDGGLMSAQKAEEHPVNILMSGPAGGVTGALRVGPESAGAVPGPVAYGKGGELPSVTDAHVVLGYLPDDLLGGAFHLDRKGAERAVATIAEEEIISLFEIDLRYVGQAFEVPLTITAQRLRDEGIEMDATQVRTAMSPGIREQGDAFPMIVDPSGKMIVGQFGSFIDGFLKSYEGTIEDGDLFFLSDPYSCEGAISHSNDWLVLLPVFKDGRLIAYTAMFGHQSDIGGSVPGSMPIGASTIFEEGVRIPPVKLWRKGEFNADLLKLVLHQTRKPDWCQADLNALIASCRVAARRVIEMAQRFGDDVLYSAMQELLARNHRAMKALIAQAVAEEPVSFEDYVCDDGKGYGPYRIKCAMWREGEKVILDFEGTDPQSAASINFYLNENMFKMFFGIYMIMVFDPQILFNDGFYDLIEVRIPEGSLLKPRFPAALSGRTHALGRIFDILGGLLGQKTPEFLNAAGFSSSPHLFYSGIDNRPGHEGEWFQLFQIGFGGIPGRPLGDGPDGHSLWPGFTNVPNEFLERYFPLRIERYSTEPDSGGAGLHRGGNGIHMTYRFLADGRIAIHDDRWFVPPWGVNGGKPAHRARKLLERSDGRVEVIGNKVENVEVKAGELLYFITWGGGGWGDPLERDPELVALEWRQGLVTIEGARDYGVVLGEDGAVDAEATEALRAEMRAQRGEPKLFDFGPPIEELRARCKEETGLDAPIQPRWDHHQNEAAATGGKAERAR